MSLFAEMEVEVPDYLEHMCIVDVSPFEFLETLKGALSEKLGFAGSVAVLISSVLSALINPNSLDTFTERDHQRTNVRQVRRRVNSDYQMHV